MRCWYPIPVDVLDDRRLLGEHNELLIMARAIAGLNRGYRHHPETRRWVGHSKALRVRHDQLAAEMVRRGFNHRSPWPDEVVMAADTDDWPTTLVEPFASMCEKLEAKLGRPLGLSPELARGFTLLDA